MEDEKVLTEYQQLKADKLNLQDYDVLTSKCKIRDGDYIWADHLHRFIEAPLLCQRCLVGDHLVIRGK